MSIKYAEATLLAWLPNTESQEIPKFRCAHCFFLHERVRYGPKN